MMWSLEWRVAWRARRLFAFNVLVPLALVLPVALSDAPRAHAAMVFTLLVVFFGTFGSAIPIVRDAESGLLGRVVLAGVPETRLFAGRIVAAAAIDLLQLLPVLLVIAWTGSATLTLLLALTAAAAASLVTANAVGAWIAAATRSIAEAALLAAVVALFGLHYSGVFRAPEAGTVAATLQTLIPYSHLHQTMRTATAAAAPTPRLTAVIVAAVGATTALVLTTVAAPALARLLLRAPRP